MDSSEAPFHNSYTRKNTKKRIDTLLRRAEELYKTTGCEVLLIIKKCEFVFEEYSSGDPETLYFGFKNYNNEIQNSEETKTHTRDPHSSTSKWSMPPLKRKKIRT